MTKFVAALVAIALVLAGFYAFRFVSTGTGLGSQEVVFDVPNGMSFHTVAQHLEAQNLVTSALGLRLLARLTHQAAKVKIGEYALNHAMTPQEILDVLVSGKSILYSITFPEGANIYEMAAVLQTNNIYKANEFLAAVHERKLIQELVGVESSSLEGYLFPETYNVTKFTPLKEFIGNMVQNFKAAYAAIPPPPAGLPALSRHELVTLASMVEKETGAPEERPIIASVFYNRLQKGMKLQSDPTILYGIWVNTGAYKANITHADIIAPTAYNTYTVPRLPAGPISNPGRESLTAVLHPAISSYLYFVSHNDGTHAFTATYEDHSRAVKKFQLNPSSRTGKSWRDLKKRKR